VDADLYVDELYQSAPKLGATLLVARNSRYICDLNRSEDDVDALAVEGGRAAAAPHVLVWRSTTLDESALLAPLTPEMYEERLETLYRPYHRALNRLLEEKREKFGYVILLAAHSMPSRGRDGHSDPGRDRADVVPGSRGRTTADQRVIDTPARLAEERGWSVEHDVPYRGGFTTAHYGRPDARVHAVQVELARRLYMDERSLEKTPDAFERTQAYCNDLVKALGELELGNR
jgi:N-formylglutamate amidohydrolase